MANYATLKAAIQNVVKTNGNNEITGALLQQSLLAMINSLGQEYQFVGFATPSTVPGTPDQNVFYIAFTPGTYANFGSVVLGNNEFAAIKYNGSWSKDSVNIPSTEYVDELGKKIEYCVQGITANLFDKDQEFRNGYVDTSGNVVQTDNTYLCTYNIPIKRNVWYTIGRRGTNTNFASLYIAARNGNNATPITFDYQKNGEQQQSGVRVSFANPGPTKIKVDVENPYIVFTVKFTASQDARNYIVLIEGDFSDFPAQYQPYLVYVPENKIDPFYRENIQQQINELDVRKAEYVIDAGKNLINPSAVQLGKYIGYSGGVINPTQPSGPLSGAACSGLIPVTPGQTYYLTRGAASVNGSAFTFIKQDGTTSTAALNPETDAPFSLSDVNNKSLAVKAPSDAKFALICLALNGWTNTEEQIYGFQFEVGSAPTAYEPYREPRYVIPMEHLPEEITEMRNEIDSLLPQYRGSFVYNKTVDGNSYIQSRFDETNDIRANFVIKRAKQQAGGQSECFNFVGSNLINRSTGVSTQVDEMGDDICPVNFGNDGGYVGANHGYDKVARLTAASHGKSYADIGSVYSNGTYNFVILDIEDSDKIIVGGESPSTYPIWNNVPSATVGTYTHVSGGVHTDAITATAVTVRQGKPILKLDETKIFVDGKEISDSGNYKISDKLIICQNYLIANYQSILNRLKVYAGTFTGHPDYSELSGVEYCVKLSISYIYTDAAHCFIAQSLSYLQNQKFSYFGFTQKAPLKGASNTRLYIPKALPVQNADNLDFRTNPIYNSNTLTASVYLTSEYWENPNLPPDRFILNDGNIVFCGGYMFDYGVGGNKRKDNIGTAFYLYSGSRKVYPHGVDSGGTSQNQDAGNSYSAMVFRIYKPISTFNQNGVLSEMCFELNGEYYLYLDFNAVGLYTIEIPEKYIGKAIQTFEKSENVKLLTEITSNKIVVNVNSANPMYGYFVGKISK